MTILIWLLALLAAFAPAAAEETGDIYVLTTNGSAVLAAETGALLVWPGQYAEITPLGDCGLYAARPLAGGGLGVIDASGAALTAFDYSALEYDGEHIIFTRDDRCGAMSLSGETLIEPVYTRLVSAGEAGFLAFRTDPLDDTPDSLWHVSPSDEEHVTGVKLSYGPLAFSEGMAEAADTAGKWGYLNGEGAWTIEPEYTWCGPFLGGAACAVTESGAGLIDKSGAWIVEPAYERIQRGPRPDSPALAFSQGNVSLISATDGSLIARFANADATWAGSAICVNAGGRLRLVSADGEASFEADEGVVGLSAQGGCVLLQRAFTEEKPFSFIGPDGARHGDWQELSFAGLYEGREYFIFSEYDTEKTVYPSGLVFYDEVLGTRRYGLLNDEGDAVADGFLSLRRTGRALLTAETESWLGLIRPDGTVIMRLEKEE